MEYKLSELIDVSRLQTLLDSLDEIYGIPSAIIDMEGNVLTATAWQDICTKFHRVSAESEKECIETDTHIVAELSKGVRQVIYRCPKGLVDTATPIIVDGNHVGNAFTGQLFLSPPDEELFRKQAMRFGFDEGAYIEALRKVPVITEQKLRQNLRVLAGLTEMLAEQGLKQLRQLETEKALRESRETFRTLVEYTNSIHWELDLATKRFTYVSPQAEKLLGYPPEDWTDLVFWNQRTHPDDREWALKYCMEMTERSEDHEFTYRMIAGDGTVIWMRDIVNVVTDEAGPVKLQGIMIDVTERKQYEEKLAESERRFRETLENANLIAVQLDADGLILFANQYLESLSGWKAEELIGKNWFEVFIPPDRGEEISRLHQQNMHSGQIIRQYENELVTRDGLRHLISWTNSLMLDAEGNIAGITSLGEDITERRLAEEKLKKSEQKFRAVFDGAEDGILAADIKTRKFVFANPGICKITGYPEDELLQMEVDRLHPAPDLPDVIENFEMQIRGEIRVAEDIPVLRKDGSVIYCDISSRVVTVGDRGLLVGFFRDITEQKAARDELFRKNEDLQAIFQSIPDLFFRLDGNDRIIDYYAGDRTALYATPEKFMGLRMSSVLPADVGEKYDGVIGRVKETATPDVVEYSLVQEGRERYYEARVLPFGEEIIIIVRDMTERKLLEGELLKSQKLESIGLLAGGIAHDFNNLLTGLFLNISAAKLYAQGNGRVYEMLEEAERNLQKTKSLTRQLLTFARGGEPLRKIISIDEVVRDSVRLALSGSNVTKKISVPGKPWSVYADEGQISQVIQNLVINAVQAMPEGGIVTVTVENSTHGKGAGDPMTKEKYVVMSIDDTGHGISGEHLPMIFDPFFTTKQKGSGLGLATAYSIVNKHDGFITVDSQLGRGTTFRVYLPATEKEILRENRRRPGALPTARGKILIMDDEDDIRAAVGTFMRSVGYEVEFVKDGAAAVEMYGNAQEAGEPYGAVILDLTIPGGMGGGETIERLKMINPQVRAIVSSGYSEDLIVSKYKDYGFKDSLPKPYSAQELIEVLNRVLNTGESC